MLSSGSDSERHLPRENRKMNMDPYFLKAKMRNMFLYLQVNLLFEVFASIVSPQDWFRVLKIVSAPSSGVLNNQKGEILRRRAVSGHLSMMARWPVTGALPFCSKTKIDISACVLCLTRCAHCSVTTSSRFPFQSVRIAVTTSSRFPFQSVN